MTLAAGTRLGPYEITAPLGAGGMGEVYRATDTKLKREVAIKVLPESLGHDLERLARFEREAQVLASLNHPHIAAIYGVEDSTPVKALVMELVEGQTLQDRMEAGPIPVDDALSIARQTAQALEAAHEKGVVHRDLKPANVKITPEGVVKVLDFGLAKALDPSASSSPPDLSHSPTITYQATAAGIILGTAAYMSPEQARGSKVDKRADIWAFGVVLWEMLTGKRLFHGETVSDTLAGVLKTEVDFGSLPGSVPPAMRRLLRRCLERNPGNRLRDIGEARVAIDEALTLPGPAEALPGTPLAADAGPAGRRTLPWTLAVFFGAAFIVTLGLLWRASRKPPEATLDLSLDIPPAQRLNTAAGPAVVISPDGSRIAYVANEQGKNQIYVRELDKPQATPLDGATGLALFFSPDGQWIGYFGDGKLNKVSVFGGAPVALCPGVGPRGASWGRDGTIVFTAGLTTPLERISASGGVPTPLTTLDAGRQEVTHRWPQILPDGRAVIFTASANNNDFTNASIEAAPLATGRAKVVVANAYFGRYLPSGFLTYVSGGTLFAVPFDPKRLEVTGTAMPVVQNLMADLSNGGAQFSVSATGTAVYLTGATSASEATVALVDRKGAAAPLIEKPGDYYSPRFSPDGKQLALQVGIGNTWIYDLALHTMTALTLPPADCLMPVWTPDGKRIACEQANPAAGGINLSWIPSDGSGKLEPLTEKDTNVQAASSWSPDGKTLAFFRFREKGTSCCEIWTLPIGPDGAPGKPRPLLGQGSSAIFANPTFSPDGRWLAYQSNESGALQVYVVPFPGPGGKRQVSTGGGLLPRWSRDGHELFFEQIGSPSTFYSVPYRVEGDSFQPGIPEALFQGDLGFRLPYPNYDVAPDGKHFAMLKSPAGSSTALPLPTVAVHWFDRVEEIVGAGQR